MSQRQVFELWRVRVRACQESDLKVTDFCKQLGISVKSYYYWKLRIDKHPFALEEGPQDIAPTDISAISAPIDVPQWVKYSPEATATSSTAKHLTVRVSGVEIDVPSDFNPTLLRSIIQTIGADRC